VLAAAGDSTTAAPHNMLELEKKMSDRLEEAAGNTLAPFLGFGNYQVSVAVRLNTDKRQTSEQTFDPESRVERSVKVVKEEGKTENRAGNAAVGVEQNIPAEDGEGANGDQSRRQEERREELTNYELNSRRVQTESNGYRLESMTMAVLVNKSRLLESLGGSPTDEQLSLRLEELSRIVSAATGINEERGDKIQVSSIDFLADGESLQPVYGLSIVEHIFRNIGTIINAFVALAIVALVVWFGLRPAVDAIAQAPPPVALKSENETDSKTPVLSDEGRGNHSSEGLAKLQSPDPSRPASAKDRLEQLIEAEEEQIVEVLKQWIGKGAAT